MLDYRSMDLPCRHPFWSAEGKVLDAVLKQNISDSDDVS
jgi:hypothetical protein